MNTTQPLSTTSLDLQHQGLTISQDQARAVAHVFNDRLWDWHTYIGYIICGFLVGKKRQS
jgi:hypothetical protein